MKVLIISHNPISRTSNMGKTLRSYFRSFSVEEVAQFYIHSEAPEDGDICRNYYRFTDVDALKSAMLLPNRGRHYGPEDISRERTPDSTDKGMTASVYRMGRKRTAGIYILRNLLWKQSRWNNSRFWAWVEDFSPDVIFFASGDYGFMYDIARKTAEHVNKPLAVVCVDDYFLHNRNGDSLPGRLQHRWFLKTVRGTMARADRIFIICESLKTEYEKLFQKPCCVLHTAASAASEAESTAASDRVSYLGNLSLGRAEQLVEMGREVKKIDGWIDIYSGERNPEYLKELTEKNGIHFHGHVSAEEVLKVMASSKAVIHTESFDPEFQAITRYSVSTKIADSLMNGPCMIAYGPEGIASIDYLKQNQAAYVISNPDHLESGLREILSNSVLRERIVNNARLLAGKNHDPQKNPENVRKWLEEICEDWENRR